ncbi:MAG: pyridoxal-phosphate dependent enzyme, partial [Planctomycetota bacterium]|nr:pyridoxal-phosphate dependent enzyme [Planctomycetota bacterium]
MRRTAAPNKIQRERNGPSPGPLPPEHSLHGLCLLSLRRTSPTMALIHDSVLSTVGGTPIVRLARIGRHLEQELYGKCEFFNPGGSVKDRIGVRMLLDA